MLGCCKKLKELSWSGTSPSHSLLPFWMFHLRMSRLLFYRAMQGNAYFHFAFENVSSYGAMTHGIFKNSRRTPTGRNNFSEFQAPSCSPEINDTKILGSSPSFALGTSVGSLHRFPEKYWHVSHDSFKFPCFIRTAVLFCSDKISDILASLDLYFFVYVRFLSQMG